MIRFRFNGDPSVAPTPRGSGCSDLARRVEKVIGKPVTVSADRDYEDWTESASLLDAIAESGLEMSVIWADSETGEPTSSIVKGRPCAKAFTGVSLRSDEAESRCWPSRQDVRLATSYPTTETFRKFSKRRVEIADMPGDDAESLIRAIEPFAGKEVAVKHFLPLKAMPVAFLRAPERVTKDVVSEVFDDPYHVTLYEGMPGCLLVQERLDMRKEARFFVADGRVVSGAGCVTEHTPLQRRDEDVVGVTNAIFRDRISGGPLVRDPEAARLMEAFAGEVASSMMLEAPELRRMIVDVAMVGGDPVLIEINPYQNSGLYANDARLVAAPVIEAIASAEPEAEIDMANTGPSRTVDQDIFSGDFFSRAAEDFRIMKEREMSERYGYYINLDERGEFYADVRNENGDTVFEFRAPDEDGGSIFEDGFMRHKDDVSGLTEHLRSIGVISAGAEVLSSEEFEAEPDEAYEDDPEP